MQQQVIEQSEQKVRYYRVYEHKISTKRIWFPTTDILTPDVRSYIRFKRRINANIDKFVGGLFITLTYNNESLPASTKHISTFFNRAKTYSRKYYGGDLSYVWRIDYGKRSGRPHYHALLGGIGFIKHEKVSNWWKKGFVWIDEIVDNRKASLYVGKYLSKEHHLVGFYCREEVKRQYAFSNDCLPAPKSEYNRMGISSEQNIIETHIKHNLHLENKRIHQNNRLLKYL